MAVQAMITRPDHDMTMHYLHEFGKLAISTMEGHGMRVIDLENGKATMENLESYDRNNRIEFMVLNGHGAADAVAGHNNLPVILEGKNDALLSSKITYAISCSSARSLGRKSVEHGAIAYVGYDEEFAFLFDNNNMTNPLEDKMAKAFLDHSTVFITSISKGNTVGEAYEKAKDSLRKGSAKS